MSSIPRLGTRGRHQREVPEYIRDRKAFTTSGALKAKSYGERRYFDGSGALSSDERERLYADDPTYVVFSYATPIAWWSPENGWHIVEQRFSVTTSKHQGTLYLIPHETDTPGDFGRDEQGHMYLVQP